MAKLHIKVGVIVFFLSSIFLLLCNSNTVFASETTVSYRAHVENIGWQAFTNNNALAGTEGQSLRMEAIQIKLENPLPGMKIKYQVHVQNMGWMNYVESDAIAGTTGQGLRVEAIKIELENAPSGYHIYYQAHVENIGWQDVVKDGAVSGTTGKALRIEGIRIRLVKDSSNPVLTYSSHVQNIGWEANTYSPNTSGNANSGLRIEALKIDIDNLPAGAKVKYQANVENSGWQGWAENGQTSGTEGKGLRVEGVRIKLEGYPSNYHMLYRSYIQGYGWQNWVKDGEISGIVSRQLRIEAIEVKVVTDNSFYNYIKPKIAIDIGHNAPPFDVGSNGYVLEDKLNEEVGTRVIQKLRDRGYNLIPVSPMIAPTSETDSVRQRAKISNDNESNLFVSIHFNAYNWSASGSEVLYMKSTSKPYADRIVNNLSALGFTNRGSKYDNRFVVLNSTNCDSIIVESCFVDSKTDMNRYNAENIANAIVNGLIN